MKLEGLHHITAITGHAQANVDFYAGVMGLRMVKKTVNQDEPSVYHLFYADELGSPGADLTFFEFPGAGPGRAGAGMVHRIDWRVGSAESLDFWEQRLADAGRETTRGESPQGEHLDLTDPEGLAHRLAVSSVPDAPLIADHPDVPADLALQGFDGVRAYTADPQRSQGLFDQLGFRADDRGGWELRGDQRGGHYAYDAPPAERGVPGAGTVHHVAWASPTEQIDAWRQRARDGGAAPTGVIDRFWFRSVYFREPSGVLFELATLGPGFSVDEDPEHLGESLILPPFLEAHREQIERALTPITNPRQRARA